MGSGRERGRACVVANVKPHCDHVPWRIWACTEKEITCATSALPLSCLLRPPWPSAMGPQVLLSGTEAAEIILRVDDIIKCAPRRRG